MALQTPPDRNSSCGHRASAAAAQERVGESGSSAQIAAQCHTPVKLLPAWGSKVRRWPQPGRVRVELSVRCFNDKIICFPNLKNIAVQNDLDSCAAFTEQHFQDLVSGTVAKKLAECFLVIGDAVFFHKRDEVRRSISSQRRFREMWIGGDEVPAGNTDWVSTGGLRRQISIFLLTIRARSRTTTRRPRFPADRAKGVRPPPRPV